MALVPASPSHVAFPANWPARIASVALALYVVYACSTLDITLGAFRGRPRPRRALSLPHVAAQSLRADKLDLLRGGMIESLQIAILATVVGVLLSLPLGLCAARNLSPLPLACAARALVALFRTFHPVIVAILFVKAVGFGALAGILALSSPRSASSPSSSPRRSRKCRCSRSRRCARPAPLPFARDHGRAAAGDVALHRLFRVSAGIPTCAIRRWSASSAAAASARPCSPRSNASTTISC